MVRFMEDETSIGETVTAEDLVTRHYNELPYPYIKVEELLIEADYYKTNGVDPLAVHPSQLLEMHNHYFYRGYQHFR